MTRDDIIRAWRAGGITENDINGYLEFFDIAYEAGVKAEREACLKIVEAASYPGGFIKNTAAAIRARGEQ